MSDPGGWSISQLLILNWEMTDLHWYLLWGFLQYYVHYSYFKFTFSIEKNRKITCSNGPQLMGKRFMAYLHASLDSTCKSRILKISTRCQTPGGPFHNFWSWTDKWKIYIDSISRSILMFHFIKQKSYCEGVKGVGVVGGWGCVFSISSSILVFNS